MVSMNRSLSLFLAISSAILLGLSFFSRGGTFLAFIALIPLLYVLSKSERKRGILLSWISGGIFFNLLFYWIAVPVLDYGGIYRIPAIIGIIVVCFLLGIFFALSGLLIHYFLHQVQRAPLLTIPAIWTLVEMLRASIFSPLPLGLLGFSQTSVPLFIQTADLYGTFGISFVVALINTFLFLLLTKQIERRETILFLVFLVFLLLYGAIQLQSEEEELLQLGLIQSNIHQEEKWDRSLMERNIERHLLPTEEMAIDVDMVIWPESAIPVDPYRDRDEKEWEAISKELERIGIPVFTGLLSYVETSLYNHAFFILDGEPTQFYKKLWLVPFGEYIPFPSLLFWVDTGFHSITPGEEMTLFQHRFAQEDLTWASPICYEILNCSLMREMSRDSHLLINLSNEAWFKETHGLLLLFQVLIMRTVELRRPIVKVANTGFSGYVNEKGEVIDLLPPYKHTYRAVTIESSKRDSLYSRTGPLPLSILLLFSILLPYYLYHSTGKR